MDPRRRVQNLAGAGAHPLRFAAPGVYNLSLTVTGILADGSPFERSAVVSAAVADPRSPAGLPPQCQ